VPTPPRSPNAGRSLRSVPPVPVVRGTASRLPAARPQPAPRAASQPAPGLPLLGLLTWPVLLTLAVTLLRLVGELRGWDPRFFSRLPGGGLAIVGITWLVPLVGAYLGYHLTRAGVKGPDLAGIVGWPVAALAIGLGIGYGLGKVVHPSATGLMVLWAIVSLVVASMTLSTWPALGKLLLAYAVGARLPVVLVMALAMRRAWGTHYDALPPGFPLYGPLKAWLWAGLLPQATIWVAFTLAVGMAFSAAGVYLASRRS
jgi:hypothetical protein